MVWDWKKEEERWIDHLPSVELIVFRDLATICNAPRLCGPASASLKTLVIDPLSIDLGGVPYSAAPVPSELSLSLQLARFHNIETLVVHRMASRDRDVQRIMQDPLDLPSLVDVLPNCGTWAFGTRTFPSPKTLF